MKTLQEKFKNKVLFIKPFTRKQYYVIENSVFRNGNLISSFENFEKAIEHCNNLNKRFSDKEAYDLLQSIRNEITLYEDGEFSAEIIINSVKDILDTNLRTI